MNNDRLKEIEEAQSAIAKKVLGAVPIAEEWRATQILTELARQTGSKPDFRIVSGCLNTLRDAGLVKEKGRGLFRRVVAKPDEPIAPTPPARDRVTLICAADIKMKTKPKAVAPLSKWGAIADSVRDLAKSASALAAQIEESALELDQVHEEVKADAEKLKQLRALLTSGL